MTTIPQFWFYSALFIAILLFLLGAEFIRASRSTTPQFYRGRGWFNVAILLIMVLGVLYITSMLEIHRKHLLLLIAPYPSARYAPERESFGGEDRWVYVSSDRAEAIIAFYQQESAREGYAFIVDKSTTTSRLLFSRNGKQLFLTVESEGDAHILYYSEDGEVQVVAR